MTGRDTKPALLSGGNPQIPKGYGEEPVAAYLDAVPDSGPGGWKNAVCRKIDAIVSDQVRDGSANGNTSLVVGEGEVSDLILRLSNLDIANTLMVLMRGDHQLNETKLAAHLKTAEFRAATEEEIVNALGARPGSLGACGSMWPCEGRGRTGDRAAGAGAVRGPPQR